MHHITVFCEQMIVSKFWNNNNKRNILLFLLSVNKYLFRALHWFSWFKHNNKYIQYYRKITLGEKIALFHIYKSCVYITGHKSVIPPIFHINREKYRSSSFKITRWYLPVFYFLSTIQCIVTNGFVMIENKLIIVVVRRQTSSVGFRNRMTLIQVKYKLNWFLHKKYKLLGFHLSL